jgi:hypothetical protein
MNPRSIAPHFRAFAKIAIVLTSLCCCFVPASFAQLASTTALVGNVTDSAGAGIPGAKVTVVNSATGEVYTAVTGNDGAYQVQFVKIGTYSITAARDGFQSFTKSGVHVESNQTVRTDFAMQIGTVSEKMTVTAEAPPITTDDATLSQTINNRQTVDLPLNGRDALKLAVMTPGVLPGVKSPAGNPGGGEDFIAAGTREIQNSVSLDGVSIMNNLITTTTFRPSVDAIQEIQVQTGTYQAQYGGYLGLQMNLVSKSGTNDFHGSVFEFVRNNSFDARGYFENRTKPQAPFHQNQFGFVLAGPVWIPKLYNGRDRTFFMADYEGLRQNQVLAQPDSVLTPLMRQGDFSEYSGAISNPFTTPAQAFPGNRIPSSLLSPQAQKALQYMPLPNLPGIVNNYLASIRNSNTTNQTIDRLDQSFGEKIRLFFRYAWADTALVNGNTNPNNGYNQPVTDRNFVGGYTQVLTPNMVNDVRFGRQHTTIDSVNFFATQALANAGTELGIPGFTTTLANSGLPALGITGYMPIGGQNMSSSNWYQTDTTWQGADLFSWTHGAHSISAGVEIRKLITLRTANNNPRGGFTFSGTLSGFAPADFILGAVQTDTTPGPLFPGGGEQWRDGFFVVDKWQASSKLTLTFGLRYELPTVPHSTNGNGTILNPQLTAFIPATVPQVIPYTNPNHSDFAPRFGFAYRATPAWVVRGGFGIYYNANQLNSYTLATTNPPFSTIYTYNSTPGAILTLANPVPANSSPTAPKYPSAFTINPDLPTARMNQWSFDVERALWPNAALDVQYLGSHSYHLDRSYYINTPSPGPGNINSRRPNQLFGSIRMIQTDVNSNYDALNVVLRQNLTHGLTVLGSYTWSHNLDINTDSNGGGAPVNPFNWAADYGNSNWDVRHRLVASFVYDLPFFRSASHGLVRTALGGWQANGILTAQTGFPFNVTVPGDPANTGMGNQRPNLVGRPSSTCGDGHLIGCIAAAAFAIPQPFTYGNAGRNLLTGPGLVNLDFSLFKDFAIRERAKFQLRGELFNSLNHPSFSNPAAVLGSPTFGNINGTSNTNRQIQLAAKLTF